MAIPFRRQARLRPSVRTRRRSIGSITQWDVPAYLAGIVFAVLANLIVSAFHPSALIITQQLDEVSLPSAEQSVLLDQLRPMHDEFDVIGEVASVDPSKFAALEVTEYAIQPGDTLSEIALDYGLRMDTLISFNQIEDVRRLQIGDRFQIPNRDGLLYTVKRGDTLSRIAGEYDTSVNAILDTNDLKSQTITEGQVLFIPNARMNEIEMKLILGELFGWPTTGRYTSGFGMRDDPFTGLLRFHNGIDLANSVGTTIRAAASGRVVHTESQIGNYGRFVIVRHSGGFQTLYAHLDRFSVRTGQTVERGQILGTMGNTGRSTGPHLHFSVIHNGTFVDPLRYLH